MRLHQQIKKYRIEAELSQAELAEAVGAHPKTILRYENGGFGIGYKLLEKIIDVLGLQLKAK